MAERILNGNGAQDYKNYLKSGNSDYALNIIQKAGVDMSQSGYLKQAFEVFEARLSELETLLSSRNKRSNGLFFC